VTNPTEIANQAQITELGRGWPARTLRLPILAAGLSAVAIQATSGLPTVIVVILCGLAVLAAALPASPAPALLIGAVAVITATLGGDPLRPAVLACVLLLYLVHAAAGIAALVPPGAVVHLRALRRPARRFGLVTMVVVAAIGLAETVPTSRNGTLVESAALVGTTALVLLVVRLAGRGR
jgi:hypothetical protein